MLGKIFGAAAGAAAGNMTRGMSGVKGAVAGTLAASAIRRLGFPGLIAAGVGGYLLKKRADKKAAAEAASPKVPVRATTAPEPQPA